VAASVARATAGEPSELGAQLAAVFDRIGVVTAGLFATGDLDVALANSSVYLEAVGHAVVAWMWLEQLLATEGKTGKFYDGKRAAARYFFRWELPKVDAQLNLLASLDTTVLDVDPAWF